MSCNTLLKFKFTYRVMLILIIYSLFVVQNVCWALPNVPLHHDAYRALDKLSAFGLIDDYFTGSRPVSKSVFVNIINYLSKENISFDKLNKREKKIVKQELAKLRRSFSSELNLLTKQKGRLFYKVADPFTLQVSNISIKKSIQKIENADGLQLSNGTDVVLKNNAWISMGEQIGFYASIWRHRIKHSLTTETDNIYMFLKYKDIRFDIGKISMWWGPGRHGSMLLSNNAAPMDTVRIYSEKPFNLPGKIGLLNLDMFLSDMGNQRVRSGANLLGLRVSLKLLKKIELSFSRVTMFSGKGISRLSTLEFLKMYFADPNQGGAFDVNELGSIDFILHANLLDIYGEISGEDEAGFRPSKIGYIGGVYIPYFPILPSGDLRIEYANNHVERFPNVWYKHHVYLTGYTYQDNIIGHHMGTDASDIYISSSGNLGDLWSVKVSANFEKKGLSDKVKELTSEYVISFTRDFLKKFFLNLNLGYETIKNDNKVVGVGRNGYLISTSFNVLY